MSEKCVMGGGSSKSSNWRESHESQSAPTTTFRRKDGSLTHEHFKLRECRLVANLRFQGLTDDEIVQKAKKENIFQYKTQGQIGNIARSMLLRLDALGSDSLTEILANGAHEQACQVNLYAMMLVYQMVAAFMVGEVGSRYQSLDYGMTRADVNSFLTRYQSDNNIEWSDATVKRIRTFIYEMLVSAGYLTDNKSDELLNVFIDPALESAMRASDHSSWLPAFNCMEVA